jgi:hypothetical protein
MTERTSTTRVRKEAKKRAGVVKGIDETDPNVTMVSYQVMGTWIYIVGYII